MYKSNLYLFSQLLSSLVTFKLNIYILHILAYNNLHILILTVQYILFILFRQF